MQMKTSKKMCAARYLDFRIVGRLSLLEPLKLAADVSNPGIQVLHLLLETAA